MRKGLGIALVAAAAVGIIAILWEPRKLSVEDHLARYFAAQENYRVLRRRGLPTLQNKLTKFWHRVSGKDVKYLNEMAKHRTALEDLGYLETRVFVVSNRPAGYVHAEAWSTWHSTAKTNILDSMVQIWDDNGTSVHVVAPKADMPIWESWIRQADMPE